MLDLCMFGITKEFPSRVSRLEKVNIQINNIAHILDSFMAEVIPYNVAAGFRNAGVSLIMDDNRVIWSEGSPHTAICLFEPVIRGELLGLVEEEEDEPNVQEYIMRMSGPLGEEAEA
jgi:hypothetical protein